MTGSADAQRREVLISGHVQGVGFRYTTLSIARRFEVSGYVKNLRDGRVQIVAEGEIDQLDQFLLAVNESMGHFIGDTESVVSRPTQEFRSFDIQF